MLASELCRRLLKSVATMRRDGVVEPGMVAASTINEAQAKEVMRHLLDAAAVFSLALTVDESQLMDALAEKLGINLVWRWYDLKEGEWHEGRRYE